MRTIEINRSGTKGRVVLAHIVGFENNPDDTTDQSTRIYLTSEEASFVTDETLDSFSARYEAAMDEMEKQEECPNCGT